MAPSEAPRGRRPKGQARSTLLRVGRDYFDETGRFPSLPAMCESLDRTIGYGYQVWARQPEYHRDLALDIASRAWVDNMGVFYPERMRLALLLPWQEWPEVRRMIGDQARALAGTNSDYASEFWEYLILQGHGIVDDPDDPTDSEYIVETKLVEGGEV